MDVDVSATLYRTKERILAAVGFSDGSPRRYVLNRTRSAPFSAQVYQELLASGEIWERGTGQSGDPIIVAAHVCYPNPHPAPVQNDEQTERAGLLNEITSGNLSFILDIGYANWLMFRMAIKQRGKSPQAVLAYLLKEWSEGRL
jgi:hypothetical protein